MNKVIKARARQLGSTQSQYSKVPKMEASGSPIPIPCAILAKPVSSGTVDFRAITEAGDRIRKHIEQGGSSDGLSGVTFVKPFPL